MIFSNEKQLWKTSYFLVSVLENLLLDPRNLVSVDSSGNFFYWKVLFLRTQEYFLQNLMSILNSIVGEQEVFLHTAKKKLLN